LNADVGQRVVIEIEEGRVFKNALYVYWVPIIALIIGIFLGISLAENYGYADQSDLIAVGVGVLLFIGSYMILSVIDKRQNRSGNIGVKMKKIVE